MEHRSLNDRPDMGRLDRRLGIKYGPHRGKLLPPRTRITASPRNPEMSKIQTLRGVQWYDADQSLQRRLLH